MLCFSKAALAIRDKAANTVISARTAHTDTMAETKPVSKILRVLILDDSPDDAELASGLLRKAGFVLKTQRFETGVALETNLDRGQWDLILCAHGLNSLPARQVVDLVAHKHLLTPVIVLARRIADDDIHQLMRAGARDVIIKGQWGRLVPAVERELAVASERRAWAEARESLHHLDARYRSMIEASVEAISYVQDGMHMDANLSYLKIFGYDKLEDLKEVPLLNLIDKQDQARFKAALRKPEGADKAQEYFVLTAGGNRIPVEVAMTPLTINGESCVQVVATDVSKRKALETKLQSMHQRDPLTGLSNRTHFLSTLGDVLKTPGGMLFGITVNQLETLNQSLGHAACDRLLVQIARQLRELTGNQATLARITGGQFAVLLDAKSASGTETLAKKLTEMFDALTANEGERSVKPDVTIQLLKLDAQHKERQAIMDRVFKAEVRATPVPVPVPVPVQTQVPVPIQAQVPIQVPAAPILTTEIATPTTRVAAPPPPPPAPVASIPALPHAPVPRRAGVDWSGALQTALAHNQMQLLFQPIINLHGEPRCFYEAQLMLRTLDGKVITPVEYMPSADAAGLGGKLDRNLMINVIDLLSKYHLEGRAGVVFVSLSSMAMQDSALLGAVQMHMKATGLDPASLILQLDETTLVQHADAAQNFFQSARAMGLGLAVDHFTGQTLSPAVLAKMNIDFFGVNCGAGGLKEDTLTAAVSVVSELGRMVLAKGIEDADIFTMLFARGVHYVQGDYLQPASPGLDYSFESEQTLASDVSSTPNWRAAG